MQKDIKMVDKANNYYRRNPELRHKNTKER